VTRHVDELAALYYLHIVPLIDGYTRQATPELGWTEMLLGDPRHDPQHFRALLAAVLREPLLAAWHARTRSDPTTTTTTTTTTSTTTTTMPACNPPGTVGCTVDNFTAFCCNLCCLFDQPDPKIGSCCNF